MERRWRSAPFCASHGGAELGRYRYARRQRRHMIDQRPAARNDHAPAFTSAMPHAFLPRSTPRITTDIGPFFLSTTFGTITDVSVRRGLTHSVRSRKAEGGCLILSPLRARTLPDGKRLAPGHCRGRLPIESRHRHGRLRLSRHSRRRARSRDPASTTSAKSTICQGRASRFRHIRPTATPSVMIMRRSAPGWWPRYGVPEGDAAGRAGERARRREGRNRAARASGWHGRDGSPPRRLGTRHGM
ncbi:unnamed protein product [Acanthosepion pharaonis]|uniref:Uncharacterized protein n=1 Tax=Acanthosepion pharaonis TaxID=158019 RepID=A0A812DMN9_ACAPH|nr:unnamed protein product [Sepia pharaonis]